MLIVPIVPSKSPYLRYWDALVMVLIAVTALIQPYEVAFSLPRGWDTLNVGPVTSFLSPSLSAFRAVIGRQLRLLPFCSISWTWRSL